MSRARRRYGRPRSTAGCHDPQRLCRQAEYLLLADRALHEAAGRRSDTVAGEIAREEFAAHAAHVLRADGWVSRERARETGRTATADAALCSLLNNPDAPDPADRALAHGALRWARELLAAHHRLSPFEREAIAVARRSTIASGRDRGLLCALLAVYHSRRARSRHLGRPGEWLETVLVVERVAPQPSQRHRAVLRHDLLAVDCNRLVWWQTTGRRFRASRRSTCAGGSSVTHTSAPPR